MSERNALFDGYLTKHYSHLGGPDKYRRQKKVRMAQNYTRLLPVNRNARILDIGPGYGELLELLVHDSGYTNVQAVDVSKEVVDFCNTIVPGSTAYVADTTSFLTSKAGQFDCIFMLHVLEHIPKKDVIPLLTAIQQALGPQGKLVLEVPNMASPVIGLDTRYADFTHEVGFTELSLRYVLQKANFSQIGTFAPKLAWTHPARLVQLPLQIIYGQILHLIYRSYALHRPKVITPALCALAIK